MSWNQSRNALARALPRNAGQRKENNLQGLSFDQIEAEFRKKVSFCCCYNFFPYKKISGQIFIHSPKVMTVCLIVKLFFSVNLILYM